MSDHNKNPATLGVTTLEQVDSLFNMDVPSTKKMQMGVIELVARMREQGIVPERPPPTTREEAYVLPGVPVEGFKELQRVFVPKASDVYVASYPKSGTTWVQHIVSLIKNNGVDDGRDIDDKWLWYEQFSAAEVEVSVRCLVAILVLVLYTFSDTLLALKELGCSRVIFPIH